MTIPNLKRMFEHCIFTVTIFLTSQAGVFMMFLSQLLKDVVGYLSLTYVALGKAVKSVSSPKTDSLIDAKLPQAKSVLSEVLPKQ